MKTIPSILAAGALLVTSTTTTPGQVPTDLAIGQGEEFGVAGILRHGDRSLVAVVLAGHYKVLGELGQSVGPYEMVGVDPKAAYVDFIRDDEPIRVWIRQSAIIDDGGREPRDFLRYSREEMVQLLKSRIVVLGTEFSAEQMELQAESILRDVLTNPIYSDAKYLNATREEYLADVLNGVTRITIVGQNEISEDEAGRAGLTARALQRLEVMREMGKPDYGLLNGSEVAEIPGEVFEDAVTPETAKSGENP